MNDLIARYEKNAETSTNKIRIPKHAIDKLGNKFYLDVYKDKIVLIPIKKGE